MNLIDLDDGRHLFIGKDDGFDTWNINPNVSPVDAIPIEWLKHKRDEHCNDGFAWIYEAVIDEWGKERI